MRRKPRENADVNKWWMCDEGRYGYKPIDQNRIKSPRFRDSNGTAPEWLPALEKVGALLKNAKPASWAVLASPQSTNEDLHLVKKLFKDQLKWTNIAFHTSETDSFEDTFLLYKDKNLNITSASCILVPALTTPDFSTPCCTPK